MSAPLRLIWVAAFCSLLAGVSLAACTSVDDAYTAAAPTAGPSQTANSSLSTYRSTRTHSETAFPVRLRIPSIEVDTGLETLGLATNQSIELPRPSSAGWWSGGPRPGQAGPAVIIGHLDTKTGQAVFFRLGELEAGDEVLVDRSDGSTARFTVTSLGEYEKTAFPSDLVYYPTLRPELRLVTCGGPIDRSTRHYRDNLVVFATQSS